MGATVAHFLAVAAFTLVGLPMSDSGIEEAGWHWYLREFFAGFASSLGALYCACCTAPTAHRIVYWLIGIILLGFNFPAFLSLFQDFHLSVLVGVVGTAAGIVGGVRMIDDFESKCGETWSFF